MDAKNVRMTQNVLMSNYQELIEIIWKTMMIMMIMIKLRGTGIFKETYGTRFLC